MKRNMLTLALAGLMLVPALAEAQERSQRLERTRTPLTTRVFSFNRARLGVTVHMKADADSDRSGARIESVIPDSPADKAGLKAGDVITRFNNTSLAGAQSEDDDVSGPGLKLVELAQELDEGDSVRIEYRRDGQTHNATVVAEEIEPMKFSMNHLESPEFKVFERFSGPDDHVFQMNPGPGMQFFFDDGAHGLGLVELNGDLGEYFGTSEGLLVTNSPDDSSSVLRAGDVILSIDGRTPTSVSQARRILGSYEDGESAKIEIMRKRQRVTVDWKVDRPDFKVRQMLPGRMERTRRM